MYDAIAELVLKIGHTVHWNCDNSKSENEWKNVI